MGKKKVGVLKVIIDTNVLVSALLFNGRLSGIIDLWKKGEIIPLLSRETFNEFAKVLSYPKFSLTEDEIRGLIVEEITPYFEMVNSVKSVKNVCRDRDDDIFLSCALSASADYIISGDKDLCDMKQYKKIKIITPHALLNLFKD